MAGEGIGSPLVRFGPFELDRRTGELRRNGARLALQGQPLHVLTVLLERPGELVTRDELRQRLWAGDTFVDFDHGVNAAVRRLRETLGDAADTPRFVETLPRRGYRFIAEVRSSDGQPPPTATHAAPTAPAEPRERLPEQPLRIPSSRRRLAAAAGLLILALFGGAAWWISRSRAAEARVPIRAIAVLPFRNLSGTPADDVFADGMTEAVTTDLASISSLRVLSGQSVVRFKGSTQAAREIAEALGADGLILGTVARSGDQVRLTAQLVDGRTDEHLWADRYQRPMTDVLALQGELARAVADAIRATVSEAEQQGLAQRRAVDAEAYTLFLRGQHLVGLRGRHVAEGVRELEASIARDPAFAPAHGVLAVAHLLRLDTLGDGQRRLAYESAQRALAIDPRQTEALVARNLTTHIAAFDWPAAAAEFDRIVQQSPSNDLARGWYATMLLAQCRADEGLEQRRLALRVNPLSNAANNSMALVLAMQGRYEESLAAFRRTLELDPRYADAHGWLGWTYLRMGRREDGIAALETAVRLAPEDPRMTARLAHGYALVGLVADARRLRAELQARARTALVSPLNFAYVDAALGDADRAFAALEQAFTTKSVGRIGYEPLLLPLYRDPRFAQMLRRLNTPGPCPWGTLRQGS